MCLSTMKKEYYFFIIGAIIFLVINGAVQQVEAKKSSGNFLTETSSSLVCGDVLCTNTMSVKEKLTDYLLKKFQTSILELARSNSYNLGAMLPESQMEHISDSELAGEEVHDLNIENFSAENTYDLMIQIESHLTDEIVKAELAARQGDVFLAKEHLTNTKMFYKHLKQCQEKIASIKEKTKTHVFESLDLSKIKFKLETTGSHLLMMAPDPSFNIHYEHEITDFLIDDYLKIFEEYKSDLIEHRKTDYDVLKNKFTIETMKNYINFKKIFEDHEIENEQDKFIQSELKRLEVDAEFQVLINKIGRDSGDGGGKAANVYHEYALHRILEEGKLSLSMPVMDRIINQINDPEEKQKLEELRNKMSESIRNLEEIDDAEHPLILSLPHTGKFSSTESKESKHSHDISKLIKIQMTSILVDSHKIIHDDKERIKEILKEQQKQADEKERKKKGLPIKELIIICHDNKEINIPDSSIDAHLKHGDSLGQCIDSVESVKPVKPVEPVEEQEPT